MEKLPETLARAWGLNAASCQVKPLANGLINDTFSLNLSTESAKCVYILQKVNQEIFAEPDALGRNLQRIGQCLRQSPRYPFKAFELIKTRIGHYGYRLDGNYYRLLSYIDNSTSVDQVVSVSQAFKAGQAFGIFARAFDGFEVEELHIPIKDFHNLELRFARLDNATQKASVERVTQAQPLLVALNRHRDFIDRLESWTQRLPKRLTHNDTKISNLLFDKDTGEVSGVVDLDTCMPGLLLYDFGDMVRSGCSLSASEDDIDVALDGEYFRAMTQGYLEAVETFVSPQEKQSLWFGVKLMPLMLAVRFLTDFLNGDCYFKVEYAQQNFKRAQNQFALFQDICTKESEFLPLFDEN